jgi:hypothetical protein
LNVFFDNCTAPVLAATLDGFISHYGHRAFHIRDIDGLERGRHSSDLEWIEFLKHAREDWLFISGDARLLKNGAERAALRSAGLHGFILASAYQKTEMNQVAATIVWQWPRIEQFTKLFSPPTMAEIPINRIAKFRQLLL